MTSKHPQRCETCGHYQTRFEYGNKKICTLIKEKVPSSYQIGIPFYIDIVGCASHSSASEPERLCDDCNIIELEEKVMELELQVKQERAGVLESIATYCTCHGIEERIVSGERFYEVPGTFSLADFLNYIASLRQQEGKP